MNAAPVSIGTMRLRMRPWRASDAAELAPILSANWDHLGPWIPARVATPLPVDALAERLDGFAAEFESQREWRYCIRLAETDEIVGEIDLFPRDAKGRVVYADADRCEIGYWLRSDVTGRGFATEAVDAMCEVARSLDRFALIEIRCDERNLPSAAVPKRLGFALVGGEGGGQVWARALTGITD